MKIISITTTRFLLLTLLVTIMIAYLIYLQSIKSSNQLFSTKYSGHTDSPSGSHLTAAEKQSLVDAIAEIASLKAEIGLIKTQLAQQSLLIGQHDVQTDADIALTKTESQSLEASQDDYEMNQIQAFEQIENCFVQQKEDTALSLKNEAAIKQSLDLDQNDLASIVDLHCKSSLCRIELKYDLTAIQEGEYINQDEQTGFSTTISSLLDAAVSKEINEINQTGIAVIFMGTAELNESFGQL